jgi:SOS-response transcriptional repressor LexA
MVESGTRTSPPGEDLLARLERILDLPPGQLLSVANWHNTPAPIRRQVEALEGTRRAAVTQLRELLDRGGPRAALAGGRPGGAESPRPARTPSMILDELWRTGKLQSLVDRLSGPDDPTTHGSAGNVLTLPRSASAEIPLINSVAAGYPRDFTDLGYPARVADSYVRSPDIADPDAFACRVVGDSMTPDYREGDIVIFSPARDIKSGMDCFVRLEPDHESTFKRIFFQRTPSVSERAAHIPSAGERRSGSDLSGSTAPSLTLGAHPDSDDTAVTHIRLQPLNPSYPARVVGREQVAGLYAAVSVTRKLG